MDETGIAWPSDLNGRYNNLDESDMKKYQWLDMTNEHFIVWMRTAALPHFRKLWGKVHVDLTPGQYMIKIANNYPVFSFSGTKSFVFTNANLFGGKNLFLSAAYLVVGAVSFLVTLFFLV